MPWKVLENHSKGLKRGLSEYRKDAQTTQRQQKAHKDTQRRQKDVWSWQRHTKTDKTRKDGKKMFKIDKDTQR